MKNHTYKVPGYTGKKTYTTTITVAEGEEKITYAGPHIKAPNKRVAHDFCQANGLGYCQISDELG